jgi:hypothetical protein
MADELIDKKITQEDADRMQRPMEIDLTALFTVMQDEILQMAEEAGEGVTPEQLIRTIGRLVDGGVDLEGAQEITKGIGINQSKTIMAATPQLPENRDALDGLRIVIEHGIGDTRSGVGTDGRRWETVFKYPYGYIADTSGADYEEVDVFLGPDEDAQMVYIIHQRDPVTKKYDEDKVMLWFPTPEEAKKAYEEHYDRPGMYQGMTEVDIPQLKALLAQRRDRKLISEGVKMPLPEPKSEETKEAFMARCMSAQAGEDKPRDQKVAICLDIYRRDRKSAVMASVGRLKGILKGKLMPEDTDG